MNMFYNNCIIDNDEYFESRDGIKHLIKKEDMDNVRKMYPDIDNIEDKFILFLDFQFCCGTFPSSWQGNLELFTDSIFELPKYVINRPLPNKKYLCINMKRGHFVSKRGVILLFDSFEELSELKRVRCCWRIYNHSSETHKRTDYCVVLDYKLDFEKPVGDNKIYTIISHDAPLSVQNRCLDGIDIFDKYSIITDNSKNRQTFDSANILYCKGSLMVKSHDASLSSYVT